MDEVDESVAYIARVEVIDGQVEEVYLHFVVSSKLLV